MHQEKERYEINTSIQ